MKKYIIILLLSINSIVSFAQTGIFDLYASDSSDNETVWAIQSKDGTSREMLGVVKK